MALDRFVRFGKRRPTRDEVGTTLVNFMGGVGEITWDDDGSRFYVVLPGKVTNPFGAQEVQTERWIEVYVDNDYIDVMTRQQDEFTNVLAKGIAEMFARYWHGELREP